jgi:hypothetical protein
VVFVCFASALTMAALFVDPDEPATAIFATAIFDVHGPLSRHGPAAAWYLQRFRSPVESLDR